MSPIIPSRYGHPKYNIFPQKSRATSLGAFKSSQRSAPGTDSKSRRKQRLEENKITVQPTEDDDGDNFFIDQEQPSDNDKLQACKKRVKGLTDYQKKIDEEIVELNEKFNAKKAKIVEDGKKFADELVKYISTSKKELEVLRAAQEVRRQQESVLRQQAKADSTSNIKVSPTPSKQENVSTTSQEVPMEVGHHDVYVTEIGQLISSVLDSVANAI